MKDYIVSINNYIKKSLAREISREEDEQKVDEFITYLNDLMVNYSSLEEFICIEFEQKGEHLYIIRCSRSFCSLDRECEKGICKLSDFIEANRDTWDTILEKMARKVEELHPGYLQQHSVREYISQFLGGDDEYFDLMILKEHVILNEEIDKPELETVLSAYLGSIKEIIAEKIEDAVKETLLNTLLQSPVMPGDRVITELFQRFRENEAISQKEVGLSSKKPPVTLLRSREQEPVEAAVAEETAAEEEQVPVSEEKLAVFIEKYEITGRETEIIKRILLGKKTKEIAYELFISPGTTRNHIQKIFSKTETHSRIELCSLIMKTNL